MSRLSIFLLLTVSACFAQLSSGRISGTVSDSSGAVIPGAAIIIKNQATELTWKVTTDAKGYYVVTNLPVGTYNVEVEAAGFRKAAQAGYDLVDAGNIAADFKLDVGTVTESVVVREVLGETVNTVSGEVGRTIDSEQVQDLALNGRNYMQLVSLIPGVALLDEDQMALTISLSTTNQSVNGGRRDNNHLMVDGGMNMDSDSNGSQINNVGVDFISELRVQTSAFSAEYGRNSGASINVVTKSGGDHYYGGLLYTIRNDYLSRRRSLAAFGSAHARSLVQYGGLQGGAVRPAGQRRRRNHPRAGPYLRDISLRKAFPIHESATAVPGRFVQSGKPPEFPHAEQYDERRRFRIVQRVRTGAEYPVRFEAEFLVVGPNTSTWPWAA